MRIKLSWFVFLPVTLIMVFLKIYQMCKVDSNALPFLNNQTCGILILVFGFILLLSTVIFSFLDKQTPRNYVLKQNIPAAVFAALSAVLLAYDGATKLMNIFSLNQEAAPVALNFSSVLDVLLTILAAIVFMSFTLTSLIGKNNSRGMSILMLFPTFFLCFRLVSKFMENSSGSVQTQNMYDLIFLMLATLFMFYHAVIFTRLESKNPVKTMFIFGLPAFAVFGTFITEFIINKINSGSGLSFTDTSNINAAEFSVLALYMLSILIEMTLFVKSEDQIDEEQEKVESNSNERKKHHIDNSSSDYIIVDDVVTDYWRDKEDKEELEIGSALVDIMKDDGSVIEKVTSNNNFNVQDPVLQNDLINAVNEELVEKQKKSNSLAEGTEESSIDETVDNLLKKIDKILDDKQK
ncbi:MAG: hypothetical protein Q8876_04410 [Bacillota bacterium]|nr:hypothetical protein [Bacillota bacterium]